jgi:hypothetical protein
VISHSYNIEVYTIPCYNVCIETNKGNKMNASEKTDKILLRIKRLSGKIIDDYNEVCDSESKTELEQLEKYLNGISDLLSEIENKTVK